MELFDCTTRLWENPLVPQVNRLKSRPPLFTWKTAEEARRGTPEPFDCPAIQSLNGQWDFWLFERPEEVDLSLLAAASVCASSTSRCTSPPCTLCTPRHHPRPPRKVDPPAVRLQDLPLRPALRHLPPQRENLMGRKNARLHLQF